MAAAFSSFSERRGKPRIRVAVEVRFRSEDIEKVGKTEDVSELGLRIITSDTVAVDTEIAVQFALSGSPPGVVIEAKGVVVRALKGEWMGIRFVDIRTEDRQAIERFVNSA